MRLYAGLFFFATRAIPFFFEAMSLRFLRLRIPGIVTNNPRAGTLQDTENQKSTPAQPERSLNHCFDPLLGFHRGGFGGSRSAGADFAHFEAHEAANGNVFAELGDGLRDHLSDRDAFVFDVML